MNGLPDDLDAGVNQKRAGHFNERLVLSLVHRAGATSAGPLSLQTGLSFQAVSVILRRLEKDGLILRSDPLRGQIGKPVTPVRINPDGAFAFGLKIGRRSADLVLLDLGGTCRATRRLRYERAELPAILRFLKTAIARVTRQLPAEQQQRIVGLGIARPGKIGTWPEGFVLPSARPTSNWDDAQVIEQVGRFASFPVTVENDATAACLAEYAFGEGKALTDFGYFYIGTFLGGGLVINDSVLRGTRGHAGAFGALRITSGGRQVQLVEGASLHILETALRRSGQDPAALLRRKRWSGFAAEAEAWIDHVAPQLARAVVSVCAVIDFPVIYIDGNFPPDIRERLVARVNDEFAGEDTHGILSVEVRPGRIGRDARAIGAAASALISQYFPRA